AAFPCWRVVITGGEPLESPIFTPLVNALKERHYTIEVETSGTLAAPRLHIDQWNVSLKLANSGVPEPKRLNPAAILSFLDRETWWKFVVVNRIDVGEVSHLMERFALPRDAKATRPMPSRSPTASATGESWTLRAAWPRRAGQGTDWFSPWISGPSAVPP